MSDTRNDPTLFQLFNEIGIINQLASTAFERILPEGLSQAQFAVLNHFVRLGEPSTPSRLANAMQVTKGAMTNTLQRLEAQGLVSITPDPEDARGKVVFITEAGRATRQEAVARVGPLLAELALDFPPNAVREVLPTLSRLRALLDAYRMR